MKNKKKIINIKEIKNSILINNKEKLLFYSNLTIIIFSLFAVPLFLILFSFSYFPQNNSFVTDYTKDLESFGTSNELETILKVSFRTNLTTKLEIEGYFAMQIISLVLAALLFILYCYVIILNLTFMIQNKSLWKKNLFLIKTYFVKWYMNVFLGYNKIRNFFLSKFKWLQSKKRRKKKH